MLVLILEPQQRAHSLELDSDEFPSVAVLNSPASAKATGARFFSISNA